MDEIRATWRISFLFYSSTCLSGLGQVCVYRRGVSLCLRLLCS